MYETTSDICKFYLFRKLHTEKNQGEIFKVLGKEQREEMKLQQQKQKLDLERMEKAAFINTLKVHLYYGYVQIKYIITYYSNPSN